MNTIILVILLTVSVVLPPPTPEVIIIEESGYTEDADSSGDDWQDYCDLCDGHIGDNDAHYVYREEYLICINCHGKQHALD